MNVDKKYLFFFIKIIISLIIICLLVSKIPLNNIKDQITSDNVINIFSLGLFLSLITLLPSLRWNLLLRAQKVNLDKLLTYKLLMVSTFFGQLLPGFIGSDTLRALSLKKRGYTIAHAVNSIIYDRIFALISLIFIVEINLFIWKDFTPSVISIISNILFCLIITLLLLLKIFETRFLKFSHFNKYLVYLHYILGNKKALIKIFALSFLSHYLVFFMAFLLGLALNMPADLKMYAFAMPVIIFASVLPITISGWGVREGASIFVFGIFNIPPGQAFIFSISFGLITMISSVPGLFFFLWEKKLILEGKNVKEKF